MEPAGGAATVAAQCYPDSVDSSPRSRSGESWDDPFPPAAPSLKLRLMCSYGGRIVPRPTDKSLCYLGGETRIVVVDRHSSLADLSSRLSRSLLGGRPFSLKYQLPNEDLDALVSVTSDEDLDNMIDEHDRLLRAGGSSSRSSRIRLFLFPSKHASAASSIGSGSLLEDSNSETWFVDALNSPIVAGGGLPRRLSGDSASVNLLGLEDDSSTHSHAGRAPPPPGVEQQVLHRPDSSGRLPSVSDSPMLETTSSFGSTSSAPCLSTVPPIRARPEDRSPDPRVGLDEQFSHMNISAGTAAAPTHPPPSPIPLATVSATTPSISTSETNRVFSDDEKSDKSDHAASRKAPAPPIQSQLPPKIEPPMPESLPRPIYANPISDSKREAPPRMPPPPSIQPTDPSYILPTAMPPEQHRHQHQHQQFIPANPHYLHHQASATMVPIQSYYQIPQQSQHFDSQIHPMYYLPIRPNPSPPLSTPTTIPIPTPTPAAAPRPPIVPSGMSYHMVSNYSYEYPAADPSHGQLYYAQPTSSPAQRPPSDAKPTRAS